MESSSVQHVANSIGHDAKLVNIGIVVTPSPPQTETERKTTDAETDKKIKNNIEKKKQEVMCYQCILEVNNRMSTESIIDNIDQIVFEITVHVLFEKKAKWFEFKRVTRETHNLQQHIESSLTNKFQNDNCKIYIMQHISDYSIAYNIKPKYKVVFDQPHQLQFSNNDPYTLQLERKFNDHENININVDNGDDNNSDGKDIDDDNQNVTTHVHQL